MNIENFLQTLPYMVNGMAGIFIVTSIIIFAISLLNRLTGKKVEGKADTK